MIKGIDIAAYLVKDPQAQIAFYRDVLGMQPTEIDEQGRGAEFTLADGSTFGVWKPEGGESGGTIMFAVDDAKAAVEHYRDAWAAAQRRHGVTGLFYGLRTRSRGQQAHHSSAQSEG